MTATPVSKEEVRMLVKDIGYTETSKRLNIKRDTLYQWAKRFGWNKPIVHAQQTVRTVRPVADTHADVISELETQTRLSLAKSTQRLAKDSEGVTLRDSKHVKNVAQTAAIVHKWDAKTTHANVMVNIALLGVDPGEVQATGTVVDNEA